jgi:hypothetical protein
MENRPIFLEDTNNERILKEIIEVIPEDTEVYIVGGMVRNSLIYNFHEQKLPERDFDLVVSGDFELFADNLRTIDFKDSEIKRDYVANIVLKKNKFLGAEAIDDKVCLDMKPSKEDILDSMAKGVPLLINGNTLPIKAIFEDNWLDQIISLPGAIDCIKDKQIKVNEFAKPDPTALYACLRFMAMGFAPPEDIELLMCWLKDIENEDRLERNRKKVLSYVGGEEKLSNLISELGITDNIFDWNTVKSFDKYCKQRF